jgi:hypothetical protein
VVAEDMKDALQYYDNDIVKSISLCDGFTIYLSSGVIGAVKMSL